MELRSWKMPDFCSNPNQGKAIMHTAGPAQVFAGPGSGKTYVTVQRIRHLITAHGVDPSHILVITFTKAAALEMRERFFRLVEPDKPPVWFGTFHAIFYHILRHSTQYRGYTIITESEKKKLLRQIVHLHKRFACLQEEDMDNLAASISTLKISSAVREPLVQKLEKEDIVFLAQEYQSYLKEFGQMDFDDLGIYCRQLLIRKPDVLDRWRTQFQFILIDEFQDISPNQYEIIKLLAEPENNLFIVGDDDQSIYGFRGASPDSMQRFMEDYADAQRIFLNVNYRCRRPIVEASLKVVGENRNRVAKQIQAAHGSGGTFSLKILEDEAEEELWLVQALRQKQASGELNQCALICRTNFDCAMWAQNLYKNGITFITKEPQRNPFQHFVIQDIMSYLALAQGEMERKHFLRIMNRPVRYIRRDSLTDERISEEALLQYYKEAPALQERIRRLFYHLDSMHNKKIYLQVHYIRKVVGYDSYLLEKYGAEKAEELIQTAVDFQKLAQQFHTFREMANYISSYGENLYASCKSSTLIAKETGGQENRRLEKTVGANRNSGQAWPPEGDRGSGQQSAKRQDAGRVEKTEKSDKSREEGIQIMTMHASKGLEFHTVYIPDCQEGKIPSARSKEIYEIEEERRMFYVAMTRAKEELYLLAHKGKSGKDAPSRFLKCFV